MHPDPRSAERKADRKAPRMRHDNPRRADEWLSVQAWFSQFEFALNVHPSQSLLHEYSDPFLVLRFANHPASKFDPFWLCYEVSMCG
jgi:hypothetical protein